MIVQSIPYPGGVSAPADITFAVQDMVTGTTTGDVDYTSATISGLTPKASLIFCGLQHIADEPGETFSAEPAFAAVTDTGSGWSIYNFNWDNRAATAGRTLERTSPTFTPIANNFSGTPYSVTYSLISGGVRGNYGSANTSMRAAYIAFAGANVSADTRAQDLATSAGTTTINTMAFEPDVVIACLGTTSNSTQISRYSPCIGVAVNEGGGTVVQRCIATFEGNNLADSNVYQAILSSKITALLNTSGGKDFDVSLGNFTSSGFDVIRSASGQSQDLLLLSLKFTGGGKKLVDFTTPTSTGNHSITGAGFTPRLALVFLTNLEGIDPTFPLTASDLMSGFSVSAVGDETWGMSARVDNLAATTDTGSRTKAAVLGANATSTNAIEAGLVSFDSDGMTLNYSAVQGTGKKGFVLFIE